MVAKQKLVVKLGEFQHLKLPDYLVPIQMYC